MLCLSCFRSQVMFIFSIRRSIAIPGLIIIGPSWTVVQRQISGLCESEMEAKLVLLSFLKEAIILLGHFGLYPYGKLRF